MFPVPERLPVGEDTDDFQMVDGRPVSIRPRASVTEPILPSALPTRPENRARTSPQFAREPVTPRDTQPLPLPLVGAPWRERLTVAGLAMALVLGVGGLAVVLVNRLPRHETVPSSLAPARGPSVQVTPPPFTERPQETGPVSLPEPVVPPSAAPTPAADAAVPPATRGAPVRPVAPVAPALRPARRPPPRRPAQPRRPPELPPGPVVDIF